MSKKLSFYIVILAILLLVIASISIFLGVYEFESSNFSTIKHLILDPESVIPSDRYVILNVRLPRIIMAILAGGGLALAGTSLQGMFRNPLASPDLIGVTSGSVLFAAIAIVLGEFIKAYIPSFLHYSFLSFMSFIGALITMSFVYKMSTTNGKTNISILLLSGVAITALSGAVTGLLIYISSDEELKNLTFWTLGSLAGATWPKITIVFVIVALALRYLIHLGKALNAMMLGERDANHLGISVETIKKRIILFAALLVGTIVAFTGTIGFVGLVVPYILRLIFKSNYYFVLPLSFLAGAILLLVADNISRTLVPPTEVPIGILTALMGAPVFIAILLKFKKSL